MIDYRKRSGGNQECPIFVGPEIFGSFPVGAFITENSIANTVGNPRQLLGRESGRRPSPD